MWRENIDKFADVVVLRSYGKDWPQLLFFLLESSKLSKYNTIDKKSTLTIHSDLLS